PLGSLRAFPTRRSSDLSVSGEASARSHLEIAWRLIPSFAASASWESPFSFLSCTRRFAISIFINYSLLYLKESWVYYNSSKTITPPLPVYRPAFPPQPELRSEERRVGIE